MSHIIDYVTNCDPCRGLPGRASDDPVRLIFMKIRDGRNCLILPDLTSELGPVRSPDMPTYNRTPPSQLQNWIGKPSSVEFWRIPAKQRQDPEPGEPQSSRDYLQSESLNIPEHNHADLRYTDCERNKSE